MPPLLLPYTGHELAKGYPKAESGSTLAKSIVSRPPRCYWITDFGVASRRVT